MEKRSKVKRLRDRSKFQTGLSMIPSLFTIGNLFCGYYAIVSALKGNFDVAAVAIGIGFVLDALDGRIARLTRTTSDFGVELDSLADVVTFGVAPAMLAFTWGIGSIVGLSGDMGKHIYQLGWLTTFAFLICGALRLARFNVQARKPDPGSKRYFVGLPIPAGASILAAWIHFWKEPVQQVGSAMLWCFLVLAVAFLMISTVRYHSFKDLDMKRPRPRLVFLAVSMLIGLTLFYSEYILLALSVVYVTSGPVGKIAQVVGRLMSSGSSAPQTASHEL